jgi:hypothetical protein
MAGIPVFPSSASKLNVQRGQVQRQEDLGLGLTNNGMQSTEIESTEMQNMDAVDDGPSPISPVVSSISRAPSQSANWVLRDGMDGY